MTIRVINISKQRVQSVDVNTPIISICDPRGIPPQIPNRENRPLLLLEFYPADHAMPEDRPEEKMTEAKTKRIVDFVKAQKEAGHERIFVQCGEGRIRSFTICTMLEDYMEDVQHDREEACIKEGIIDRYTRNIMKSYLRKVFSF